MNNIFFKDGLKYEMVLVWRGEVKTVKSSLPLNLGIDGFTWPPNLGLPYKVALRQVSNLEPYGHESNALPIEIPWLTIKNLQKILY